MNENQNLIPNDNLIRWVYHKTIPKCFASQIIILFMSDWEFVGWLFFSSFFVFSTNMYSQFHKTLPRSKCTVSRQGFMKWAICMYHKTTPNIILASQNIILFMLGWKIFCSAPDGAPRETSNNRGTYFVQGSS